MKLKKIVTALSLTLILSAAASAGTIKLVEVMTSPERTITLKEIISKFEADNPEIKVDLVSLPWGEAFEKLATMIASGEIPDVVEMPDTWYENYAASGMLENLDDYFQSWAHKDDFNARAIALAQASNGKKFMLPYGFYLRALFYNQKLFDQAGVTAPPKTMEEFIAIAEQIAKLPGKSAYCMRGASGGLNSWVMFGAAMGGDNTFFNADGKSTFSDENWVKGLTWMIDLYKKGYAPKDSINWGFNETVAGFYSGTCAMLDQDPDALIAIAERMKPEDYGVVPMPKGSAGKAFPTIGYAGWSVFKEGKNKDEAWKLFSALADPAINITWNKRTGALPVFKSAEQDPFYANPKFKGWFDSLSDENIIPTVMPTFLKEFALFKESLVPRTSQQAMLGEITPKEMAKQWSNFLTKANLKAKKK